MSKFNFNIDIQQDDEEKIQKSKYNSISQRSAYDKQYYIDLDLPSKTLWCKYNLGANVNKLDIANNWIGDYYAWGELETKNAFYEYNYKFKKDKQLGKITKYNPLYNLQELTLDNDIAYVSKPYNFDICIPSVKQYTELFEHTKFECVSNYLNIQNLNGALFIGKNNNQMFIPYCGYYKDMLLNKSSEINLWTNSLTTNKISAYSVYIDNDNKRRFESNERYFGFNIRPVVLNKNYG